MMTFRNTILIDWLEELVNPDDGFRPHVKMELGRGIKGGYKSLCWPRRSGKTTYLLAELTLAHLIGRNPILVVPYQQSKDSIATFLRRRMTDKGLAEELIRLISTDALSTATYYYKLVLIDDHERFSDEATELFSKLNVDMIVMSSEMSNAGNEPSTVEDRMHKLEQRVARLEDKV